MHSQVLPYSVRCFMFYVINLRSLLPQKCRLCYPCLRENEREFIKAAYLEHNHRGGYRRIYPPPMVRIVTSAVCKLYSACCKHYLFWSVADSIYPAIKGCGAPPMKPFESFASTLDCFGEDLVLVQLLLVHLK